MRKLGHDVLMVPMYLPLEADKTEMVSNAPVFFGGINVYLQQKLGLFRKTPRWVDWLFDRPGLLGLVAKKATMTSARDLGETTVSMLQGSEGKQAKELDRLVEWLGTEENRADIVVLSNILLAGLAGQIKARLNVPVACLLQDEDSFLDGLSEPYAGQAWGLVRRCAHDIDAFVAANRSYAEVISERLSISEDRMHVVDAGLAGASDPGGVSEKSQWNAEQMIDVYGVVCQEASEGQT